MDKKIKSLLDTYIDPEISNLNESYDFIRGQKLAGILNEIDWEGDFSDVKKTCLSIPQLVGDLQAILDRSKMKPWKRGKAPLKTIVHNQSIQQTEDGEIDVQAFIDDITAIPDYMISKNKKMQKTSTGNLLVLNTGLPALRGIVYDIENQKFYEVNTCPGAGSCVLVCYARKGSYVQYDHVSKKLIRRLNLLMNDPQTFEDLIMNELVERFLKQKRKKSKIILRWNDSGDFFANKYWEIAMNVTKKLQEQGFDFESYAYTKMGKYADLKDRILTNFSLGANKRETDKVKNVMDSKRSQIVPKDVFKQFFAMDPKNPRQFAKEKDGKTKFINDQAKLELKNVISQEYDVPVSTLRYIEELPEERGKDLEFNAIIRPSGDSDEPAHRRDVKITFLLIH